MCKHNNKKSNLNILSFNVEGLASELDDPSFLDMLYKHDICLLNETWKADDSKIGLPGMWDFSVIRPKSRNAMRHSGGVSVLCKEDIRDGIKVAQSSEGFVWLKLDSTFFGLPEDIYLCAAYIPPEYTTRLVNARTDYFRDLTESLAKFSAKGQIVISGDLNARIGFNEIEKDFDIPILDRMGYTGWGDNIKAQTRSTCDITTNRYGKKLEDLCKGYNLHIANGRVPGDRIGGFTCFTKRGNSVVDYVVCDQNLLGKISKLTILDPAYRSVHAPLSFSLNCKPIDKGYAQHSTLLPSPPKLVWDVDKRDVFKLLLEQDYFQEQLFDINEVLINPLCTKSETATAAKQLTDAIFEVAKKCFKVGGKRKRSKSNKPKKNPWYNKDCVGLKKRFRNIARLLKKSPNDPYVRGKYFVVKKEYRNILKLNKTRFEVSNLKTLQSLTGNPKAFWNFFKKINKTNQPNGEQITGENWINHFSAINNKDPALDATNSDYCNTIKCKINRLKMEGTNNQECPVLDRDFTSTELMAGIKRLKRGKATAFDAITNDLIRAAGGIIAPILTSLFNKLSFFQHYPLQWSTGLIVPIHKNGDNSDPNNFRGITLNNSISKLYTLLLNDRLTDFCENNKVISDNQIGFRRNFRTSDHVFTLKTLIDQAFSSEKKLYTCFVDFRKAYDTVWRDGLILKMLSNGVSNRFCDIIQAMYQNLQSSVQLPCGISMPFQSKVGLKQGCNLSPMLFNIFINGLIKKLGETDGDAPMLGEIPVGCLFYADDLVLISETKEGLQRSIDTLYEFINEWFLEVNLSKTKCLIFEKRNRDTAPGQWMIGEELIEVTKSYCYLGVVFDNTGSLVTAYKALRDKALGAMFSLIRNINKHRTVSPTLLFELFDKMVAPIVLYNSEVWGTSFIPLNNADILDNKLLSKHTVENLHLTFVKIILGVPMRTTNWAVTSESGRYPLALRSWEAMVKFWQHLRDSRSSILTSALSVNIELHNSGHKTWYSHLDKMMNFFSLGYLKDINCDRELRGQLGKTKSILHHHFNTKWVEYWHTMKTGGKLELFSTLIDHFGVSDYLKNIKNSAHRVAMTRMRVSAHKFPIETGRYYKINRELRECPLGCKTLGDEYHYMTRCSHPFMKDIIDPVMHKLSNMDGSFGHMAPKDRVVFMLGSKDRNILSIVAKFCFKLEEQFKDMTY